MRGSEALVTASALDGGYGLAGVPAGIHTIEFSHPEYLPSVVFDVAVADPVETTLDLALTLRRPSFTRL